MGCRALYIASVAAFDADAFWWQQRNPTGYTHAAKLLHVDAWRLHAPSPTHWTELGPAIRRAVSYTHLTLPTSDLV